jgi:hypothetical protein
LTADSPYSSLTLDFQLDDDIIVTQERFMFAVNGTVFNKDKGYRVPPDIYQPAIDMFDKNEKNSKIQIFISNYFFNTLAAAILEKQPFSYPIPHNLLD